MSDDALYEFIDLLEQLDRNAQEAGCMAKFFSTPEERAKYPHWMDFFEKGKDYFERLAMCANQVGKTTAGLFEVTLHATGLYPDWWPGKRISGANNWWLGGIDHNAIREALQDRLLGPVGDFGTGFIPKDTIDFDTLKAAQKSNTGVRSWRVRHVTGGFSTITLKSYKEGREAWQAKPGTNILLDEEPPMAIYTEALMRAAVGDTMMILTFTPIKGMSDVTMSFLNGDALAPAGPLFDLEQDKNEDGSPKVDPDGRPVFKQLTTTSRYLVRASWDNSPHLTEERKAALLRGIPKFQRDARTKGIPTLGAGAIYQVSEELVFIDPFPIPKHWKRSYGMDVGWNRTAAVWGAIDPDTGMAYIYAEHYLGEEKPVVHAEAVRARGKWIPGCMDPAARGRGQDDGQRLFDQYTDLGLNLVKADNAVTGPLWEIAEAMEQGRFKIFNTCTNLRMEFRIYRRDEKGQIVKKNDHALDSLRYWWNTGRGIAITERETINTNDFNGMPTYMPRF